MISMDTLVFIIGAFCAFKDPKISKEYKESCASFMANCCIVEDGKSSNKQVDMCRELWISK